MHYVAGNDRVHLQSKFEIVGSIVFIDLFTKRNIFEHKSWLDAYVISTFLFRFIEIHLCRRLNELAILDYNKNNVL